MAPRDGANDDPQAHLARRLGHGVQRLLHLRRVEGGQVGEIVAGQRGLGEEHHPAALRRGRTNEVQHVLEVEIQRPGPVHLHAGHLERLRGIAHRQGLLTGLPFDTLAGYPLPRRSASQGAASH